MECRLSWVRSLAGCLFNQPLFTGFREFLSTFANLRMFLLFLRSELIANQQVHFCVESEPRNCLELRAVGLRKPEPHHRTELTASLSSRSSCLKSVSFRQES